MTPTELTVNVCARTDVGQARRHNEDFIGYYQPSEPEHKAGYGSLYLVADGVGGGTAGEVASRYAGQKVLYEYYHSVLEEPGRRLQAAFEAANTDIFAYTAANPHLGRMGTTMVAAVILGNTLTIANVGDSRAYLLRDGEMRRITEDHSLVARLVAEGQITPAEAQTHPNRNVVLRSLGKETEVTVDIFDGIVVPDDRLLLCSDGLLRHLSDDEIHQIIGQGWPDEAVQKLIGTANSRGGKDNISVMLLTISDVGQSTDADAEPPY